MGIDLCDGFIILVIQFLPSGYLTVRHGKSAGHKIGKASSSMGHGLTMAM